MKLNFPRRPDGAKKNERPSQEAQADRLSLRRQSVVLAAVVVMLLLGASIFGLLDGMELSAVNWAFQRRGPRPPASPVVIVAIDDNPFGNTRLQWPWPRTYFAQMVDRLAAGGAKVIAFDVFLFEPGALGAPATYTVLGEGVTDIAERYEVSAPDIIAANNLDNTGRVCGGQELIIPTNPPQKHTVVRDTLDDLAARYQVGTGWLAPELIGFGDYPELAMNAAGDAEAVWPTSDVWAARYSACVRWRTGYRPQRASCPSEARRTRCPASRGRSGRRLAGPAPVREACRLRCQPSSLPW